MWIADGWNDYEVLDTSAGEKLERWGDYILVRPDPQVIWNTPHKVREWKQKNGHYHRSNKGGGQWEFFDLPEQWEISYGNLKFHLKPFHFKHTGLFPEQATNWDWFSEKIRNAGRPVKVLNLFAWCNTCSSCCRRTRNSCRRFQGNGYMGKRKCCFFRTRRRTDPLAG